MPRKKRYNKAARKGPGRREEPWCPYGLGPRGWVHDELRDLHPAVSPPVHNKKASLYNRRQNQYAVGVASLLMKAIDRCDVRPQKADMAGFLNANAVTTFRRRPWTKPLIYHLLHTQGLMEYVAEAKETYALREAAILAGLLE